MEERPTVVIIVNSENCAKSLAQAMALAALAKTSNVQIVVPSEAASYIRFDEAKFIAPLAAIPRDPLADIFDKELSGIPKRILPDFDADEFYKVVEKLPRRMDPIDFKREVLCFPPRDEIKERFPRPDKIPSPKSYKRNRFIN